MKRFENNLFEFYYIDMYKIVILFDFEYGNRNWPIMFRSIFVCVRLEVLAIFVYYILKL